jgi:DnaJ-class molecular chaperone
MHKEDFDEDEAHRMMKEINAAKKILMDEEKRDLHDRILKVTKRY